MPSINATEFGFAAFQLPRLHSDIPTKALISKFHQEDAPFAKMLLDAGVITPCDIPDTATTPRDILKHGLESWFTHRTSTLKIIKFSVSILDCTAAQEIVDCADSSERTFKGNPVLAINSVTEDIYELKECAESLENACKGLFRTALDAVEAASYMTVSIRTPGEIFNDFAGSHWETDWSEIPSDDDARETLIDRFGEDEVVDAYLPSNVAPIFGNDFCLPRWTGTKFKKSMSQRKLRSLAKVATTKESANVAIQTAVLLDLIKEAKKHSAEMPDLCGIYAESVTRGCCLIFQDHEFVWSTYDDRVNYAWNSGEATDLLGMQELPGTTEELKKYFYNLDLSLAVLRQMDKLIGLISKLHIN